jgi:hypothetical protein
MEKALVKYLYSGDSDVVSYTLCDPYEQALLFDKKQLQAYHGDPTSAQSLIAACYNVKD